MKIPDEPGKRGSLTTQIYRDQESVFDFFDDSDLEILRARFVSIHCSSRSRYARNCCVTSVVELFSRSFSKSTFPSTPHSVISKNGASKPGFPNLTTSRIPCLSESPSVRLRPSSGNVSCRKPTMVTKSELRRVSPDAVLFATGIPLSFIRAINKATQTDHSSYSRSPGYFASVISSMHTSLATRTASNASAKKARE